MVGWILKKIFGSKNQRELKRWRRSCAGSTSSTSNSRAVRRRFARQNRGVEGRALENSGPEEQWRRLDEILPEAFAVVKNAARRLKDRKHSFTVCDQPMTWDMVHFDVQLLGGMVLHRGRIAEMATGEGKTLVATLPLYLNALTGRGAHLVTVNDYLARRDAEWMGQLYNFLGLTVGCIRARSGAERAAASNTPATSLTERTASSGSITCATTAWRRRASSRSSAVIITRSSMKSTPS